MKYKLITIMLTLILVATVTAYSIGQIVTQQQIDSFDVSQMNLGQGFARDGNNQVQYSCKFIGKSKICNVTVLYDSLRPLKDENGELNGNYIIYEGSKDILFRPKYYRDIANEHNLTYARQILANKLKAKRDEIYLENEVKIEGYQTPQDESISDLMEDLV